MTVSPAGYYRILAIDVRPRKIGYVLFENSEKAARVLDSGTRKMRSPLLGARRVASLIAVLRPSVIIVRKILPTSTRYRPRTKILQRRICELARRSRIKVVFIGEDQLHDCFKVHGTRTKHGLATVLAKIFPELAWKLPDKRKIYEREPWSLVVFDAAALGVTYLARTKAALFQEAHIR